MSGGGILAATLLIVVVGILVAFQVAQNLRISYVEEEPYAELTAPDSIVWAEGEETMVWVATNLEKVDLRVDSPALGLGAIQRTSPGADGVMTLGRGAGCLEWAVASLEAESTGPGGDYRIHGTVERNGSLGDLDIHLRYRFGNGDWRPPTITTVSGLPATDPPDIEFEDLTSLSAGIWYVQAAHDPRFPETSTKRIVIESAEPAGFSTADVGIERLRLLSDMGVGLVACGEHDDVTVSVHGEDGEELNRYLVDVGPAPTPTPTPPPATPFPGQLSVRVCVDEAGDQFGYLSGGELAGVALDQAFFNLTSISSAGLTDVTEGSDFTYFFDYTLASNEVQLSVSDVGASGAGLQAGEVYAVRLTVNQDAVADDPNTPDDETVAQATASIDLGVWLDTTTPSPTGDGSCS